MYTNLDFTRLKDLNSIYARQLNATLLKDPFMAIQLLSTEEAKLRTFGIEFLKHTPLLIILIPHVLKFYLLFVYYAKFRLGLSRFLKIRFYINMDYLLSTTRRNAAFRKFSIGNPSSSAMSETNSLNFRPRFRPICCCCWFDKSTQKK